MFSAEDLIERHEGRRSKPYKDTRGFWTIGIGHKMQAYADIILTEPQIDALFNHDMQTVWHELDLHLPNWRSWSPSVQLVLQDMCFEMGIGGLMKFQNFLAALRAGEMQDARREMLDSDWAKQVPNRANDDADLIFKEAA